MRLLCSVVCTSHCCRHRRSSSSAGRCAGTRLTAAPAQHFPTQLVSARHGAERRCLGSPPPLCTARNQQAGFIPAIEVASLVWLDFGGYGSKNETGALLLSFRAKGRLGNTEQQVKLGRVCVWRPCVAPVCGATTEGAGREGERQTDRLRRADMTRVAG